VSDWAWELLRVARPPPGQRGEDVAAEVEKQTVQLQSIFVRPTGAEADWEILL